MKREYLSNVFTGILVLCAVVVTGLLLRRELMPAGNADADTRPRSLANWTEYQSAGQRLGSPDAPVTVVEFSDFQCPFCAQFANTLREIQERHPGRVQVLYRHYPLQSIHPHAVAAAVATECAARQSRFHELHDLLFARQDSIGRWAWSEFARRANVADVPAFERCLTDPQANRRVQEDLEAGIRAGVKATPTIIANGQIITGGMDRAALETALFREDPR